MTWRAYLLQHIALEFDADTPTWLDADPAPAYMDMLEAVSLRKAELSRERQRMQSSGKKSFDRLQKAAATQEHREEKLREKALQVVAQAADGDTAAKPFGLPC